VEEVHQALVVVLVVLMEPMVTLVALVALMVVAVVETQLVVLEQFASSGVLVAHSHLH
jgi:hypothetical protein